MSILEAFGMFSRNYLQVRQYSKVTIDGYWWVIKSFVEAVGNIETEQITTHVIGDWTNNMAAKGNTRATVVSNLNRFRVFVDYLNLQDICLIKGSDVYVPRRPQNLPKYVTVDSVTQMIIATKNIRDKAILAVLFSSGIRNTELRNLTRGDINGDEVRIVMGKGKKDRITYISAYAQEIYELYLKTRYDKSRYAFTTSRGEPIAKSTLRYIVAHAADKAGVPHASPHQFRHGMATYLMKNNMPTRYVQELLGHENLSTTQQYMHVTDADLRKAHNQIMSQHITYRYTG